MFKFNWKGFIIPILIPIVGYRKILVLEFIIWLERKKGIEDPSAISRDKLIEYISSFLLEENISANLDNINNVLSDLVDKDTVINYIADKFGVKKANKIKNSYFEYKEAKYSAMILYSFKDNSKKIGFYTKYSKDLDALSSNTINIFFSKNDTLQKSGYSVLNNLVSERSIDIKLPALLIWDTKLGIKSVEFLSLEGLNDEELFMRFENLILTIRQGHFKLENINKEIDERLNRSSNLSIENLGKIHFIKNLIRDNEYDNIFLNIENLVRQVCPNKLNKVAVLNNFFNRVKNEEMLGLISKQEIMINYNNLNYSLLMLLDEIEYS